MRLKFDECESILQDEIVWCLDHPNTELTEQQHIGFMNGLRQAQYVIRMAEDALKTAENENERKENKMDKNRELALQLAVNYCQTHQNEDVMAIAEKFYEFLNK